MGDTESRGPALSVELIDERNAVIVCDHPAFRVTLIDGTSHATYLARGSFADIQEWIRSEGDGQQFMLHVEFPLENEPGKVALARIDGDFWED